MASTEPSTIEKPKIGSRDKSVGWYIPTLDNLSPTQWDLLENYGKIPHDRVIPSILELRDRAWEVYPFPCVGQFRFIELSLCDMPLYPTILQRIQNGGVFVDVGCCFGQDIRKLVHDGAPAKNTWGVELVGDFVDLGYELFNDAATLESHMLKIGIFDAEGTLDQLTDKVDVAYLGLFLHLFDWDEQKRACQNIVRLMKNEPGVVILGQQIGSVTGHQLPKAIGTSPIYKHDPPSFEKLWKEVGEATGTEWKVTADLDFGLGAANFKDKWGDSTTRRLVFEVERVR
ncbi:hypothetical protein BGW36DRAFT_427226 [Talaromyces proteolyticus]|uniref:Methyltransferase type 11 domain-containing protein n=1 Tax=Talaromyces proteolyticus TaxID=1131652 RepID=A0AAD4PVY5_9EURO|nr:uncharacterized protein BGW36DRAFT_427226 [Talaromyces proteolyticus]KAH8697260.1 hypothetical protein BGW36DRAFT_427226 [Talaromyces proteolyticus]